MQLINHSSCSTQLPVRYRLKPALILSLLIFLLTAIAALTGILNPGEIYGHGNSARPFHFVDMVTLFFALPALLLSILLTYHGKRIGLICWAGMLYYLLYNYIPLVFDVPFGILLLPYLFINALSLGTLIIILTAIDVKRFASGFDSTVPARVTGGILIGLGFFVILHQAGDIIMVISNVSKELQSGISLIFADFILAIPSLFGAGILLWQKRSFGYFTGGAIYFAYGMLCIGLLLFYILETLFGGVDFDFVGFIIISIMTIFCAVPFTFFIIGSRFAVDNDQF